MQTKEIQVGDRKITIREITYLASLELNNLKDNPVAYQRKLFLLCTSLNETEIDSLGVREGVEVISAIVDVNGWNKDFQKTSSTDATL